MYTWLPCSRTSLLPPTQLQMVQMASILRESSHVAPAGSHMTHVAPIQCIPLPYGPHFGAIQLHKGLQCGAHGSCMVPTQCTQLPYGVICLLYGAICLPYGAIWLPYRPYMAHLAPIWRHPPPILPTWLPYGSRMAPAAPIRHIRLP
jgi:hypothetical protein